LVEKPAISQDELENDENSAEHEDECCLSVEGGGGATEAPPLGAEAGGQRVQHQETQV
jgi:hypothetical protein